MKRFFKSNDWQWRLCRTIVQGIIGVILANADVFINAINIDSVFKPVIVAIVMAILSPIMAEMGGSDGE